MSLVDIGALTADLAKHIDHLERARASINDVSFYPYDILANAVHLDSLLTGANRDLAGLAGGEPIADIGAADGDLAFVLEAATGWDIDIIDTAATNFNGLRGARSLREALGSNVMVHDIDLDRQFRLPRDHYGLVLFLGILYHLQNPFLVLRELAEHARHCLVSTRVARFAGAERSPIAHLPVGYLVAPTELNGDATNYWVLSQSGLERLVQRAGWAVLDVLNVGDTRESDPTSAEHDERSFMLLRSTVV